MYKTIIPRMYITLSFALTLTFSFAQLESKYGKSTDQTLPEWVQKMYEDNPDPGLVMDLYEAYYQNNEFKKNNHTQYYKRWIKSIGRKTVVNPEYDRVYLEKTRANNQNRNSSASWISIGPYDWDHTASNVSYAPGSVHVYTTEQAITDPDVLYAGTATAGIWRSSDRGSNWSLITKDILVTGCTALEIDHSDENIVYAEMLSSIYKTTDGGVNWNPTGDASFQSLDLNIKDIRMHPSDSDIIFACTNNGFYKSIDAGANWVEKESGDILEIEFQPFNPNQIYIVKLSGNITEFYRSTDAGENFTLITNGWPAPNLGAGEEQRRTEIAVSDDDPDLVVALATGEMNGGSGLVGVYVSNDGGANWNFQCCGPQPGGPASASNMNLMGWSDEGLDNGGQYYYDLALDISPTNADSIFVGGVNHWVSGDGGSTFVCPAKWSHSGKPNYVHADLHDIQYYAHTGEIWISCDGGIFYSDDNGANFTRKVMGISGTDFWGYGQGFWYGDVMLGGAYHNGTMLREENVYNNGWVCTDGGDGVRGYVHPHIDRQVYSDYNIKYLRGDRTLSPLTRTFDNKPNATYTTGFSSDMLFHPQYYHTWYSGTGGLLMKTEDNGYSFQQIYDFVDDIASGAISMSDPNVIYIATNPGWWSTKRIFRSDDAGMTWTEITPAPSVLQNNRIWIPYDIVIDPTDPMKVFIARTSMYSTANYDGTSVYSSTDGGANWNNISGTGLHGESPTCIALQAGSNDALYVGTRRAVYYRDNSLSDWELYNTGLPAKTHSIKLEPYYRKQIIRNATGRSVYETDFKNPNTSVIANFSVQLKTLECAQDTAYFVDHSIVSENGVSWQWTFEGGNPATSTERTPKVLFESPGKFDVTLTVTDANGSDTKTIENMVEVIDDCDPDKLPNKSLQCDQGSGYARVPDLLSGTTNNFSLTAWIKPDGIQNNYSSIVMNDGDSGGLNFRESNNTLGYHWPGGSWSWDSNLVAPEGEWSHVAMVVTPTSVTLYLNGVASVHNTTPDPLEITTMRIGSYKGWGGRTYNGDIDEVCIWNRSLTQDEIRSLRHLTKKQTEVDMLAYYRFNREGSTVYDSYGANNGNLTANGAKVDSNCPIGPGVSDLISVTAAGTVTFPNTNVEIVFPSSGDLPNGEIAVSKLDVLPSTIPASNPIRGGYYIVNNYGSNQTFEGLVSIKFNDAGIISGYMSGLSSFFEVHTREENGNGANWTMVMDQNIATTPGYNGVMECMDASSVTTFGQYMVTRDNFVKEDAILSLSDQTPITVEGGRSMLVYVHSDEKALAIPVVDKATIESIGSPSMGLAGYSVEEQTVVYFNGDNWEKLKKKFVATGNTTGTQTNMKNVSFTGSSIPSSAIMGFDPGSGMVRLSQFSNAELADIDAPAAGMILFNTEIKKPQVYDGKEWCTLGGITTSLLVNNGTNTIASSGIAFGTSQRDPNAVLHLESDSKVLALHPVTHDMILEPIAGLVIYDLILNALLLFDGDNWCELLKD